MPPCGAGAWDSATIGAMLGTHFSRRVLTAAVVLPAAIAWADQLGIDFANSRHWQAAATVLVFGGFMPVHF